MVLGIIIGFFGVFLLFVFSMLVYFKVRSRFADKKWMVEISFIGFALVVAAVLNFIRNIKVDSEPSLLLVMATLFRSVFGAIANLIADGLQDPSNLDWLDFMYFGSALYATLMTFGVISSKASYELYSFLSLAISEKRKDIYIFTALNEETLILADSVSKYTRDTANDGSGKKRNKKAVVVFAGSALIPFDRHNELCSKVMAKGYLYWSFQKAGAKERSLANIVKAKNYNGWRKKGRYVIFAFESEDHLPKEEKNMSDVFSDIETRINAGEDGLQIQYFILTKRQVEYAAYDYKQRSLMFEYFLKLRKDYLEGKKCGNPIKAYKKRAFKKANFKALNNILNIENSKYVEESFKKYLLSSADKKENNKKFKEAVNSLGELFAKRFILDIWNEASVISDIVLERSNKLLLQKFKSKDSKDLKVMCLGFGETGKAISTNLYSNSTFVWEDGVVSAIDFSVYDKKAADIESSFSCLYPYVIVKNKTSGDPREQKDETLSKTITEGVLSEYKEDFYSKSDEILNKYLGKTLNKNEEGELTRALLEAATPMFDAVAKEMISVTLNPCTTSYSKQIVTTNNLYKYAQNFSLDEAKSKAVGELIKKVDLISKGEKLQKLKEIYFDSLKEVAAEYYTNAVKYFVRKEMTYPTFRFNKEDCGELTFLSEFKKNKPDMVVIALGEDYDNVKAANALIKYFVDNDLKFSTTIFVNIYNEQNKDLIVSGSGLWKEDHSHLLINDNNVEFSLYVVGCNGEVYSAKHTVETENAIEYHFKYNVLGSYNDSFSTKSDLAYALYRYHEFAEALSEENDFEILKQYCEKLKDEYVLKNEPQGEFKRLERESLDKKETMYYALAPWLKASNKKLNGCISIYHEMLQWLLDKDKSGREYIETLSRLATWEHQRWNRLHIAFGWTYKNDNKNELTYRHNCLAPYRYVRIYYVVYDLFNFLLAWKFGKKDNKK